MQAEAPDRRNSMGSAAPSAELYRIFDTLARNLFNVKSGNDRRFCQCGQVLVTRALRQILANRSGLGDLPSGLPITPPWGHVEPRVSQLSYYAGFV